jgi:SAM-dependent methyltransferase
MDDTNKKTIESYSINVHQYIANTPNSRGAVIEGWIDESIKELSLDSKILEIGSAYGHDAKYIEDKGFHVEKTDATQAFVEILVGIDPTSHSLNIVTDEIDNTYDLIVANAVLLHLNDKETVDASKKIFDALDSHGTFALTLKQGESEAWQNNKGMAPRYFNYWHMADIVKLLSDVGFVDINAWVDKTDSPNATWIMIITKKG